MEGSVFDPFNLFPNHLPEEARQRGRYVLENDEKVDVLLARAASTIDGKWFCKRYPTPGERLAYARRAYARWRRGS
jgi:hypothetical protein